MKDVIGLADAPAMPCANCYAILTEHQFKKAVKVPIPLDENYKFVNKQYLDQAAVDLYGRVAGLKDLLDAVSNVWLEIIPIVPLTEHLFAISLLGPSYLQT